MVNWVTDRSSGKQYVKLSTTVNRANDAARLCDGVGGILPEPRNSQENDFVNIILGTSGFCFLGLTDTGAEGQWVWSSNGSTPAWSFWGGGEPDGGRDEHCAVHIYQRHLSNWHKVWTPTECIHWQNIPVVCEKTRKYTIYHQDLLKTTANRPGLVKI